MKKIIVLFCTSIVLTAIFSYSLNIFLKEDFITLTLKTMLIPCFTWSILLLLAWRQLPPVKRSQYFVIAGWICAIGSLVLVPGGIYNFISPAPAIQYSVINVLLCVAVMSFLFYILLKKNNFSSRWWWAFNILICINMSLFYLSAKI
ncbi:MAG: hypothetical protein WDO16_26380 [Bacteroidota bacterium]